MNKIHKIIISFFSLHLILCLIINIRSVSSLSSNLYDSPLINEIHKKLVINDQEIQELTKKLQFRLKSSLQHKSEKYYQQQSYKQLYDKLPTFRFQNLKLSGQSISYSQTCRIQTIQQNSHINKQINYHIISSHGEYFIFINNHIKNTLSIYDFNCSLLTQIHNLNEKFIFQQEKGASKSGFSSNKDIVQHQSVYVISEENQLIQIDLTLIKKHYQESKSLKSTSKKTNQPNFYRILNNKLVSSGSKEQIIGVLIKTLNSPQSRTKQDRNTHSHSQKSLVIALDSSQIRIYDQSGALKLTMKQPSPIDDLYQELYRNDQNKINSNDKSLQLVNHHPYPILMENNWIYFIDTNKYTRHPWSCPYIPNVKKIYVQNLHSNEAYVLTQQKILKFNIKSKDSRDPKKGHCQLQKSISYFDPFIKHKKPEQITFTVYKNLILLDNLVYNMTSNLYLSISPNKMIDNNVKQSHIECYKVSLQYVPFISSTLKKPPNQKHFTIVMMCKSDTSQYLHFYSITQTKPQSSVLIYIIFAFLLVILFAIKFFKSNGPSYEKQLLFPHDLSADQRQIRKEQYEQLYKYMDQAKTIQKEQKIKNQTKQMKHKNKGHKNKKQ